MKYQPLTGASCRHLTSGLRHSFNKKKKWVEIYGQCLHWLEETANLMELLIWVYLKTLS